MKTSILGSWPSNNTQRIPAANPTVSFVPPDEAAEGGGVDAEVSADWEAVAEWWVEDDATTYGRLSEDVARTRPMPIPYTASSSSDAVRLTGAHAVSRSSMIVGRVWNVLLTAYYFVVLLTCIAFTVRPVNSMAEYPGWVAVWTYLVFLNVGTLMFCWACADKRRIRARHPRLLHLNLPLRLTALAVWIVVGFLFVYFVILPLAPAA